MLLNRRFSPTLNDFLIRPVAIAPKDFADNESLVDELCTALKALQGAKEYQQIAILLMRVAGVPAEEMMKATELGSRALEKRLSNLCKTAQYLHGNGEADASSRAE